MSDKPTTSLRESDIPRSGDLIDDRYLVKKIIGRGGMSCIVCAQQLTMQRDVAIKLLHPHVASEESTIVRFKREVHLAKTLTHPNIIQYYDYGTLDNGSMYLVMELLHGCDLHATIRRQGTLGLHRAIDITIQILDGLTEAHAKSVIHRDLKPRNLFMVDLNRRGDFVKILDFGIAKSMRAGESELTKTGVVCGTPSYLAPELLITQQVSPGSDLYSVGLVFLEMLTGRRAFKADTMARTFFMQLRHPVPIPAGFRGTPIEKFLLRALAKHPDDRFQTAQEMIDELESLKIQFREDTRLDPDDIDSLVDSASADAPGLSAIDNMGLEMLRDPAWAITPTPIPVHLNMPQDDMPGDDEPTTLAEWGSKTRPSRAALSRSGQHSQTHPTESRPDDPNNRSTGAGLAVGRSPRLGKGDSPARMRTKRALHTEEMQRVQRPGSEEASSSSDSKKRFFLVGGLALALLAALALTVSANFWNNSASSDAPQNLPHASASGQKTATDKTASSKGAPDFAFVNKLNDPPAPSIQSAPDSQAQSSGQQPSGQQPSGQQPSGQQQSGQQKPEPTKPESQTPETNPAKSQLTPPKRSDSDKKPATHDAKRTEKSPSKPARKPRRKKSPSNAAPAPASIDEIMKDNTIFGDE